MSTEAYSLEEATEILDCSQETTVARINAGDLPGLKFGRGWIIPKDAFRQRLNEIALIEAQERRKQRQAATVSTKAIKAAQGTPKKPGRTPRLPPALPAAPSN